MGQSPKKRKKKQATQKKLLIETSMQEERLAKPKSAPSEALRKVMKGRKANSSYYVLYEFKTGLILSLIDFYYHVKLFDTVADAIAAWSDKFGRGTKSKVILESLMLRLFPAIPSEKEVYLRRTETVIDYLLTGFMSEIDNMVGEFRSDEVVSYPIRGKESYKGFLALYTENKFIALRQFWEKHRCELDKIVAEESPMRKKDEAMYQHLKDIQADMKKAEMHNTCKGVGDAVIATDCPASHRIVTSDEVFKGLCGAIGKPLCLIKGKKQETLEVRYIPEQAA